VATSGVSNFDPTFDDILSDAVGMVGGGPILADELTAAKRGLDYMLTMIQNKGPLLHKIETTMVSVSTSVTTYSVDNTTLDVLYAAVRTSGGNETQMERHGYERWAELPNKTRVGRPTQFWFDRRRSGNFLNVWPLPDQAYTVALTIQKTTEDTVRAFDNIDVPRRFLPAILFGLAYWIGLRRHKRVPAERLAILKAQYDEALRGAIQEDRERGSVYIRIGRR
jgi:hypothetical protein